jgi:DNA (cytosine-5)-methyltransferase 1
MNAHLKLQDEVEELEYVVNPYEDNVDENKFLFLDLCSGIGGFHQAIERITEIESQILLAADIDKNSRDNYIHNYNLEPYKDLTKINVLKHKQFNGIFAGFPCQPFSVAGNRLGLDDARGTIIHYILNMILQRQPELVVLENVKGLKSLKNSDQSGAEVICYKLIYTVLQELGYYVCDRVISPHEINIPQRRDRVVIVGIRKDLVKNDNIKNNDDFGKFFLEKVENSILKRKELNKNKQIFENDKDIHPRFKLNSKLEDYPDIDKLDEKQLEKLKLKILKLNEKNEALELWNEIVSLKRWKKINNKLLQKINKTKKNYLQEHLFIDFLYYKDSLDIPEELFYHHTNGKKRRRKNKISKSFWGKCKMWNEIYENSKEFRKLWNFIIKKYHRKFLKLPLQYRYLEYSGGEDYGNNDLLNDKYCQFRMSGVRIRSGKTFPTLVKSGPMPVLINKQRYLTNREGLNLQSFSQDFELVGSDCNAMNRIGNAVNVEVIEIMMRNAFEIIYPEKFINISETSSETSSTVIIEEIIDIIPEEINYKKMKVKELKKLCKERGIKGYSKLKKKELINLLK